MPREVSPDTARGRHLTPMGLVVPPGMVRRTGQGLGASVTILLPRAQAEGAAYLWAYLRELEGILPAHDPASEVGRLNARSGEPVEVSPTLFTAITQALELAQRTGGLYDPTRRLPPGFSGAATVAPPAGAWHQVLVDRGRRRLTLPPGVGLSLGPVLIPMALDLAARHLQRRSGVERFLLWSSGTLRAVGQPSGEESWLAEVTGPRQSYTVPVFAPALSTQGPWPGWARGAGGRNGEAAPGRPPRQGLWSVTVAAPEAAWATTAARAALALGPRRGAAALERWRLTGLLTSTGGLRIPVGAWPLAAMVQLA